MLTFIIFSFNRAMQLDTLLRSIVAYAQTPCRIVVLYNCTASCQNGYELLKKQYPQVGFRKERKLEKGEKSGSFPWTLANLKRFVRYEYLRHVKSDFRALLIDILRETEDEYIAFLTDDSVFIRPFELPKDVTERISAAPRDVSFSLRLGTNISSQLNSWREFNADIITWDYDDPWNEKDWRYFFSVDGHVYAKQSLIKLCDRVLFCNPNSFEAFACDWVRRHRWFRQGLACRYSKLLSFPVNIVQNTQKNESLSRSPEFLERKFLKGWRWEYPIPAEPEAFQNYPDFVRLRKIGEEDLVVKTS